MSARKSLPIGIILMILMMAFASLGVGYAWWTEPLIASGTIQTGSNDIKLEDVSVSDSDFNPLSVATCVPSLSGDGKSLSVVINNAYPGYSCVINFKLTNVGTVPTKIINVNLPVLNEDYGVVPSGALVSKPMLDPGKPEVASFSIRVRPGLEQGANYRFDFSIDIAHGNAP